MNMIFKQKRGSPDIFMEKISYDEYRKRTNHASYWYNLTPHPITLVIAESAPKNIHDYHRILCVEIPASGTIARVEFSEPEIQEIDGFKIHEAITVKGIVYLPEPIPNVMLLVSGLVREQLRNSGRMDVFSPDTGITAIRNDKGGVFAVRALQRAQ